MALNYRALTEEDISRLSILPAGEHEFYISQVEQKKSKGGLDKNGQPKKIYDMLELKLKVFNEMGNERQITDWVLIVDSEDSMGFKLRHLAATCNLLDKYESNTLDARDFPGKHGVVKIGVRDYVNEYGEKKKSNSVIDYVKPLKQEPKATNDFVDDDIPNF